MSKRQIYNSYTLAVTLDLNAQISYISIPDYLCLQWSSQAHLLGAEFTPGPAQKTLWTVDLTEENEIKWVHEADLTEASWTPTLDRAAKFSGPVCTASLSCKHFAKPVFNWRHRKLDSVTCSHPNDIHVKLISLRSRIHFAASAASPTSSSPSCALVHIPKGATKVVLAKSTQLHIQISLLL